MSLANKLHKIGQQVTKKDIKEIIEVKEFKEIGSYVTLQINITKSAVTLSKKSVESNRTMFTKKIGGTSNSYYLYPNFEYQKESNLYKKFKAVAYTFENSVMLYANEENKKLAQPIWDYVRAYDEDVLGLKLFPKGNYFLIITINGKTFYELMPEIWDNYYVNFVDAHIVKKVKKVNTPQLTEQIDFITHKKELCGYNPNIKFFTMDNYHDTFKLQIIEKLPMSKETAIAIKKGWMYAITHLKFYHKGLEYIIIPSMVNFDDDVYKKLLTFLRNSNNNIKNVASKEDSFVRRLLRQIEGFDKNGISLDILFTEINLTNLSVKIFATLEDVIPSRINQVVKEMKSQNISANIKREEGSNDTYLRDYFSREELFAIATKNTSGMKNIIIQEKIFLAKLLLGYAKINYLVLLQKFEHQREYNYEHKRRLTDEGIKKWITYSNSYVVDEDKVLNFLESINAIQNIGVRK